MSDAEEWARVLNEFQKDNETALRPALEYIVEKFINRVNPWPFDRSDDYRAAAIQAYQAIRWILEPLEKREVKYTKRPYAPDKPVSYERREAGGDE